MPYSPRYPRTLLLLHQFRKFETRVAPTVGRFGFSPSSWSYVIMYVPLKSRSKYKCASYTKLFAGSVIQLVAPLTDDQDAAVCQLLPGTMMSLLSPVPRIAATAACEIAR